MHIDLDAFFCAVEEQRNPSLMGLPFAVGGKPHERGVVASCSYAARKFGVKSAMPMAQALRLCPDLIILSSRHRSYSEISNKVMNLLKDYTQLVEQLSIDEAFLDVSELPEPAEDIAHKIQARIRDDLSLPCSIGVATNKLLAKTANDVGKAEAVVKMRESGQKTSLPFSNRTPNAITVVPSGEEASFLKPLPVQALWGVGPKTAERLQDLGIKTIGDLALYPENELARLFGKNGYDLARRAKGIDDRPIITYHKPKSISQETTFAKDEGNKRKLHAVMSEMSNKISQRLKEAGYVGTTVKIKIRWPSFKTISRQITLPSPTNHAEAIYQTALVLFENEWSAKTPIRLIGVGITGLVPPDRQLSFWDDLLQSSNGEIKIRENRTRDSLQEAIEELRQRYGDDILRTASSFKVEKE